MKINSIFLENFKGVRGETRIDLKPITLLFGANSAGKSTILQALLFLYEIIVNDELDPDDTSLGGEFIKLGGFRRLINTHYTSKTMKLGIAFDITDEDLPSTLTGIESQIIEEDLSDLPPLDDLLSRINKLEIIYSLSWSELEKKPKVDELDIYINDDVGHHEYEDVCVKRSTAFASLRCEEKTVYLNSLNFLHEIFYMGERSDDINDITPKTGNALGSTLGELLQDESVSTYKFINEENKQTVEDSWEELLNDTQLKELKSLSKKEFEDVKEQLIRELYSKTYGDYYNENSTRILLTQDNDKAFKNGINLTTDRKLVVYGSIDGGELDEDLERRLLAFQAYFTSFLNSIVVEPIDLLRLHLKKLIYVGPLRVVPSSYNGFLDKPKVSEWANGVAAWRYIKNCNFITINPINDYISSESKLNLGYKLIESENRSLERLKEYAIDRGHLEEDFFEELSTEKHYELKKVIGGMHVVPSQIGVGVSQVLPVVVATLKPGNTIVAVEQPELHIHPRIQVALGDMFAAQVNKPEDNNLDDLSKLLNGPASSDNVIYLLETHSEHLILRLLKRIRQTSANELPAGAPSLTPNDVAVLYVESTSDGMKITNLEITDDGDFHDEWPSGFFEERDEELFL